MTVQRVVIARVDHFCLGVPRGFLADSGAIVAAAYPVPVYDGAREPIGRVLAVVADGDAVVADVEMFAGQSAARLLPQYSSIEFNVSGGRTTIAGAVLEGLLAADTAVTAQQVAQMGDPQNDPNVMADPAAPDVPAQPDNPQVTVDPELPVAPVDTPWDPHGASARMVALATGADGSVDTAALGSGFLYQDPGTDGNSADDYQFPVADVIGGELLLVPDGVAQAAQTFDAGGPATADIAEQDLNDISDMLDILFVTVAQSAQAGVQATDAPAAEGSSVGMGLSSPGCGDCGSGVTAAASTDLPAATASTYARHVNPPAAYFGEMAFTGPTPITVTADGEVFGHVADWKECHRSFTAAGICVPPPRSRCDYCEYHVGSVVTADGQPLRVGSFTVGGGHADLALDAAAATRHYDNIGAGAAVGVMREDAFGPYFHGALTPFATDQHVYAMMAFPPSGDWREPKPGAGLEMIAVTSVPTPGFGVKATLTADGAPSALIMQQTRPYGASSTNNENADIMAEVVALRNVAVAVLAASIGRTRGDELAALSAAVHH